jgi:transposase-like protein
MLLVELNVLNIMDRVGTEADAYELLEELRWGDDPLCAHCGASGPYYIRPMNGESRRTRTGSMSERRVWKCRECRKQFSVLTGTIFHGSKIPVRTWLLVIHEMCSSKNGVAAREIERKYNLTPKSAWFLCHRIREAMKREPLVGLLRGTVIADETYIGGAAKNRHHQGKKHPGKHAGRDHTMHDKAAVLSLVDKATGEVRSQLMERVDGANLRKAIAEQVDMGQTTLHTDKGASYNIMEAELVAHETVDHGAWEYVRGDVTTNHVEGYFSQLKRSLDGTHHHVTVKHLPRYLAEFDFRYSTRKASDSTRTQTLISRVGDRRLSYKPLQEG